MGILLSSEVDPAAAGSALGFWGIVLVYAVLIGAMWFFFMRPQSKEKKKVASMLAALELGDVIMTTSGFYGVVIDIDDDTVVVEFGSDRHCRIPMDKSAISRVEKPDEAGK